MSTRDPGLANERTLLAWQRTALSLTVASAILLRLTYERLGAVAILGGGIAFTLSLWVFVESRMRYAHSAEIRRRTGARGGRAAAWLAIATGLLALTELLVVLYG